MTYMVATEMGFLKENECYVNLAHVYTLRQL